MIKKLLRNNLSQYIKKNFIEMVKKDPAIGIEFGYKYSRIAIFDEKDSFRLFNFNDKDYVITALEKKMKKIYFRFPGS